MLDKISKWILIAILTVAVIIGAYLAYVRYFIEVQRKNIEICVDFNEIKALSADQEKSLDQILDELKKSGVLSIGVFEETLADGVALGELYFTQGSSVSGLKQVNPRLYSLYIRGLVNPHKTYVQVPDNLVRKRVYEQLKIALGKERISFLGTDVLEVNAAEPELCDLPLGLSEKETKLITAKGFMVVPRVWNHKKYSNDNLLLKLKQLKDYELIIFDGEEVLGFPAAITGTAQGLKDNNIGYGYIEIINQYGNKHLRRLSKNNMKKVHSISRDEIKKLNYDEVLDRFIRAAKDRSVDILYVRPFLPAGVKATPTGFFLYFTENLKKGLEAKGFVLGNVEKLPKLRPQGWQLVLLGMGVITGLLFLMNYFYKVTNWAGLVLVLLSGIVMIVIGSNGYALLLQKALALLAAITFPSLAVIETLAKPNQKISIIWDSLFMVINVLAETMIGVFLIIGLLADYRFMLSAETFTGVKIALLLPIMIVAVYFILDRESGSFKEKIVSFLNSEIKMFAVVGGLILLAGLLVLVARSGNFIIPVPGFEKIGRRILEAIMYVRPRTKEFLFGYPFLFLAAVYKINNRKTWLWLYAALGSVAMISVTNSFTHVHTPLIISIIRTFNGLELGIIIGLIVALVSNKILNKQV